MAGLPNLLEAMSMLDQLMDVYEESQSKDVAKIHSIRQMQLEAKEVCTQHRERLKHALRELSDNVERVRADSKRPEPERVHQEKMRTVQRQKETILENIKRMEAERIALEGQIKEMRRTVEQLQGQAQDIAELEKRDIERESFALELYAHATRVKWDRSSPDVKGYVSVKDSADVRPFHVRPGEMGRTELATYLWELADPAKRPALEAK
eukprot:tig00020961_g16694.t1